MFMRRMSAGVLIIIASILMSACSWNAERNEDGSWTVTGNVSEGDMQQAIDQALADPLITNIQADFHDGYISATADRTTVDGTSTDLLTFRVDLSVVDGHLGLVISNATLAGEPIDEAAVSVWNQRLANKLERAGNRRPNSTLQSVSVTENDLTMVWRVEQKN